jgi:hypothetical protein
MDKGRTWLKHTIQGGVVQNRVCIVWIKEGLGCIKSLSNLDKGRTWLYHNIHGGVKQNIF